MRPASYLLSLCLHAALLLLVWFWPVKPPIRLDATPVMISLVEGDIGGNRTPSPILGHVGDPNEGPKAPTAPAPKEKIAAPTQAPTKEHTPLPSPPRDEVTPIKKPEIKLEPKPEPKTELVPPKDTKPKEAPKPPAAPKKDKDKDKDKVDHVKAALDQVRRKTSSRVESGDRGNAVEQALAQALRSASGNHGGGGGEGEGSGGGLGDVYIGQIMLAVRPNWGFASAARVNLSCVIRVSVDMQGKVQQAELSRSSGNAQFDASAINAVVRTGQSGQFPPPPSQEYTNLDLVFTLDELMRR
ncbi:MAG: TonB family protein [Desulfovibrio sp.]|jgi:TonB family protein|nr:TonB family protein [Desulfovibrio sp.]